MTYCATLEVFGARDRSLLDPSRFSNVCTRFLKCIEAAASADHVTWYVGADVCFIESDDSATLLRMLQSVADAGVQTQEFDANMPTPEYFAVRGVAMKGRLGLSEVRTKAVRHGWTITSEGHGPSDLLATLRSFKGVGVRVDLEGEAVADLMFKNAWPTCNSTLPYLLFEDLRSAIPAAHVPECLDRLISLALEANAVSRKSARFYVPALIRIIRCSSTSAVLVRENARLLERAKGVAGIELAQLAILNAVFDPLKKNALQEVRNEYLRKSKLADLVRLLQEQRILPSGLVCREAIGAYGFGRSRMTQVASNRTGSREKAAKK